MAQVDSQNNPNDPNNPNNPATTPNQNQTQGINQPATSGGGGAVTSTGAGNVTGQVTGTNNPAQPFQNISSYLAANGPQSQQLAGQVADTVSKPISQTNTDITNAGNAFTQSVNAGYTPENNDLISAVSSNPAYTVAENPDNVTNFQGQLNDKYTGPTDFTTAPGYNDLQTKIAAAQAQAANTGSESGIQTLLKSVEGPTTAGVNKLDSLLLSANPDNYKTIQDAGKGAGDLTQTLTNTTTAQNAAAAQGSTNAAKTAADALAALGTAHGNETTNLSSEQKSIEDIVNQYNQSVGVINPVVQDIASAIQNFLSANPNINIGSSGDPLADLKNLASIVMPQEAAYASPQDYAQIAALTQLGDTNTGNFAINSSTADQAQTFKLPTQLMDALGKAPGVEKALSDQLNQFGGQINTAIQPFQAAQAQADKGRADFSAIVGNANIGAVGLPDQLTDPATGAKVPMHLPGQTAVNPAWNALANQAHAAAQSATQGDQAKAQIAPGLQWVNSASGGYNDLIQSINSQLAKLGSVGVPSLNYSVNGAASAPNVAGAPIGKQAANAASIAEGAGIPAATSAGLLAGSVPTTASALAAAGPGAVAGELPAAGLTGVQAIGPAGLAAYGTSNIIQNAAANPIKAGLGTLANTGLSLATLSLPPKIFDSIGKEINSVMNSIGNFFKGLF